MLEKSGPVFVSSQKDIKSESPINMATLKDFKTSLNLDTNHLESVVVNKSFYEKVGIDPESFELSARVLGKKRPGYWSRNEDNSKDHEYPLFLEIEDRRDWDSKDNVIPSSMVPDSFEFIVRQYSSGSNYYHHYGSFGNYSNGVLEAFVVGFNLDGGETIYITGESNLIQKIFNIKLTEDLKFDINGKIF
jgi:hypothetical protein